MTKRKYSPALVSGLIIGLLAMFLFTGIVSAAPNSQGDDPPEEILTDNDCVKCHRRCGREFGLQAPMPMPMMILFSRSSGLVWALRIPAWPAIPRITFHPLENMKHEGVSCQSCHGTVTTNHPDQGGTNHR